MKGGGAVLRALLVQHPLPSLSMATKKKTVEWPLALRLRIAFGGERPAPESKDHVTY